MQVERKIAYAPRTTEVGQKIARLHETCVGCAGCRGICRDFIELLTIPEAVLRTA